LPNPGKYRKGSDEMIYVTGDTHGSFERVEKFCKRMKTSREDILIILGDAGINFNGRLLDCFKKTLLEALPITIFAIHGNHEQRPYTIDSYREQLWHGGTVYYEEEFPHILFAKDGEIFHLDGRKTVVIGGAYSIDKEYRLTYGYGWWEDEQPSEEIKQYVEAQLAAANWEVDIVLSHTTPLKYEPVEMFMAGVEQGSVDKSTEIWLDKIENRLSYKKWYCGHYHTEKKIDRLEIMFENIEEFGLV
jgi:3-oxoacid CoA-transferase subunit A